jgi:Dolichyl-phosphate-mannose-protein mannosyltransferase
MPHKRWLYALWLLFIGCFALLHAFHLSADFPNHTPWTGDWAKYTDEGWYGNAAIRAHLFGHWYLPGDLNPAPALPVWPFLEWVLFFFTRVSVQSARGLAVAFFFCNLLLSYLLLRARGPRWTALLAVTLIVTSPFLYCFSRLAILEPPLIAFTLTALNLAVRMPRMRRPLAASAAIGLLFTLMVLTKTTAVFLLPALGWAMAAPLWRNIRLAARCILAAAAAFAVAFGLWMALVIHLGLFADYKYLFTSNQSIRPSDFFWPFVSLWWSFHGGLWMDQILIPLAGLIVLGAALAWWNARARKLLFDPVFGASVLAVAGTLFFMACQNHPQPRYFVVAAFFCFFVVAQGAGALLDTPNDIRPPRSPQRILGWAVVALVVLAAAFNGLQTLSYAAHPEYTFVDAARRLTQYIDAHPNGKRLLVSSSGDEITLITRLPALCDDFGTQDLASKLDRYQPGWFAAWNDLDPGTLADIHQHFSLEQAASFRAFDDTDRNLLVLFKLHPIAGGRERDPEEQNLQIPLPGDKIDIHVE